MLKHNLLSADDDCPLPAAAQTRNILCFAGLWCLYYLAAPVSYVGVTHANLLKALGGTDTVANLPHAVYQWMSAVPILVAWFLPQPRLLKPLLVTSLLAMAGITAVVPVTIWLRLPASTVTAAVVAHAAIFGGANGVVLMTLWELLRRGVSSGRRGRAMGMAFGIGPLFACAGSLGQQVVLSKGSVGGMTLGLQFPDNYLVLFAVAAPIMLTITLLGVSFIVPLPEDEPPAGSRLPEIVEGVRGFFTYRPIVMAAVTYLLVYSGGNAIMDNVSIHARQVLGESETLGYQNFLRFGFKAAAGVFLGWLLTKASPKATLIATTSILLVAMAWVLTATGRWYLISLGLLGAGELFGAYFPNYVTTASVPSRVRSNIAYLNLLGSGVGFASILFGWISDRFGRIASFHTATGVLIVALILILLALPARPRPQG